MPLFGRGPHHQLRQALRPLVGNIALIIENATFSIGLLLSVCLRVDKRRQIIVQIEDPEPLAELEEICQVPGIDMIFFGPGDFSHALGIPGELDSPEVNRARRRIAETAHKHGKFAGTTCSMENMKAYFQLGYDFLNCGSDVSAMNDCCDRIMKLFRN